MEQPFDNLQAMGVPGYGPLLPTISVQFSEVSRFGLCDDNAVIIQLIQIFSRIGDADIPGFLKIPNYCPFGFISLSESRQCETPTPCNDPKEPVKHAGWGSHLEFGWVKEKIDRFLSFSHCQLDTVTCSPTHQRDVAKAVIGNIDEQVLCNLVKAENITNSISPDGHIQWIASSYSQPENTYTAVKSQVGTGTSQRLTQPMNGEHDPGKISGQPKPPHQINAVKSEEGLAVIEAVELNEMVVPDSSSVAQQGRLTCDIEGNPDSSRKLCHHSCSSDTARNHGQLHSKNDEVLPVVTRFAGADVGEPGLIDSAGSGWGSPLEKEQDHYWKWDTESEKFQHWDSTRNRFIYCPETFD